VWADDKPVPMEHLVRLPDFGAVSLSPDGTYLAATTPVDGKDFLIILDITDPAKPETVYQMKPQDEESVVGVRWISDERLLFSTERKLGTLARPFGTGNVYAMDYDGKRGALISGPRKGRSIFGLNDIIDLMPEDPRKIKVVTRSLFGDRGPDAEIIDTTGNQPRDIVDMSPFDNGGVLADSDGNLRFAAGNDAETNELYYAYRPTPDAEWVPFDNPFNGNVSPLSIADDGKSALVTTNAAGNFGILRLNLETMETEQLITHDKVPVNAMLMGRDNETLIGVEFLPGLPEVQYMDTDTPDLAMWKRLHASFPGQHVRLSNFTADGSQAIITVISDRQPPRYFLFDADSFQARYLFDSRPQIDADQMLAKESHWITARDGLEFQLYVTKPKTDSAGPYPTVFVIHGGPHGPRDVWAFDAEAQLLASRGYAVIQPNYRGSGGFGRQFERAGYKKWGAEMQDDVTDATLWAIEQGIADPNKTCIYGGSYGGFATLSGITREPGLYACAFAFVGVYDLGMMKVRGDIPDSKSGRTFLDQVLGTDKDDYMNRSPVSHVDKIITPLYIAHGKADKRVPVQQFYNLKDALDDAGIPYEELLVGREGHGFYSFKNRMKYYRELLSFLNKHIGPNAPGKAATTAGLGGEVAQPVAGQN
jgi:dipeptidyl aminopeptidase/acylaminoacyl peptidase